MQGSFLKNVISYRRNSLTDITGKFKVYPDVPRPSHFFLHESNHIQNVYSRYNFEACTYNRSRDIHIYISNKPKYGKLYIYYQK